MRTATLPWGEPPIRLDGHERGDDWRDWAACRGMNVDIFYPPHGARGAFKDLLEAKAKAVCADCSVVAECRAAGKTEKYGIWGATTPDDRGTKER